MGFLSNLFERRAHPAADIDWAGYFGLKLNTAAGMTVTNQGSLQQSAVFACVRVLSEDVAKLPLILYRRRSDGGKDRATDHPLYPILHDLPNPEMSSIELRETLMGHVGSWGNGYAEIQFNGAGNVMALWPLRPDRMKVARKNGRIVYVYEMPPGTTNLPYVQLPFERVMHIKGLGYDGMVGYDPVSLARQTIGLALGTEEFGARFFGNGATTGTVYEHPGKLSDDAYNRLVRSIEKRHQGLEHSHRIAILEEGMKANQVGIPPENAQFLETRKFQVAEIARWYRMPLHKIAHLENATFSNIEHQSLEYVVDTLQPWLVRWEQAGYRDLLTPRERTMYFLEHLVAALLRGDIQSRYEAYAQGRQNGWLSANDIRRLENMNPVDGGDVYLVPLNMIPADQVGGMSANEGQQREAPFSAELRSTQDAEKRARETRARNLARGRLRLANSFRRVIREATGRVIRREIADTRRAINKFLGQRSVEDFSLWLQEFYEEHKGFWKRQLLPVLLAYADQVGVSVADELGGDAYGSEDIRAFIDQYVQALADREAGSSHLQLQALLDEALQAGEEPEGALGQRLDEWEEKRVGKVTEHESRNALNAFALAFYTLSGVTELVWRAIGDSCPYCLELDGRVVGIQQTFLNKGEDFQPEGADRPINKRHDVRHAPLHGGCDCQVMAA